MTTDATPPKPPSLADPDIEQVVERYGREMARYEKLADAVLAKISREMRAAALHCLLSARAKHPDDLRGKLRKNRSDPRYTVDALLGDMNRIVTDLAGCRVVTYRLSDEDVAADIVRKAFAVANLPKAFEKHRKPSGYWATHLLVAPPTDEISTRGAVCEVQICSLSSHLFNEVEHDESYKEGKVPLLDAEKGLLGEIRSLVRVVDPSVERYFASRRRTVGMGTRELQDHEALRWALEALAERPLQGDFLRLYRLLNPVVAPLTLTALQKLGAFEEVFQKGTAEAERLRLDTVDDATCFALGLPSEYLPVFKEIVADWRGPTAPLKKAILEQTGNGS